MNKFKVGDKIRVREDLVVGKQYGSCIFASGMEKYKGKILIVGESDHDSYCAKLSEGDEFYFWSDKMLEPVESTKPLPTKQLHAKYAIVKETFVDAKELRKYLKEHKDEKLTVYSVKKPVTYKITSVVNLKEK
jgi:hypothetical protein